MQNTKHILKTVITDVHAKKIINLLLAHQVFYNVYSHAEYV